ncbi:hypothetical protein I3760_06G060800 [Carya illinoinensis]|nr:hypothetical protein I3760_06G060800 [Carya illinoinensis]
MYCPINSSIFSTTLLSHNTNTPPDAPLDAKYAQSTCTPLHKLLTILLSIVFNFVSCKHTISTFHSRSIFLIRRRLLISLSPRTFQETILGFIGDQPALTFHSTPSRAAFHIHRPCQSSQFPLFLRLAFVFLIMPLLDRCEQCHKLLLVSITFYPHKFLDLFHLMKDPFRHFRLIWKIKIQRNRILPPTVLETVYIIFKRDIFQPQLTTDIRKQQIPIHRQPQILRSISLFLA